MFLHHAEGGSEVLPATRACLQGFCEFLRCYRGATEVLPKPGQVADGCGMSRIAAENGEPASAECGMRNAERTGSSGADRERTNVSRLLFSRQCTPRGR